MTNHATFKERSGSDTSGNVSVDVKIEKSVETIDGEIGGTNGNIVEINSTNVHPQTSGLLQSSGNMTIEEEVPSSTALNYSPPSDTDSANHFVQVRFQLKIARIGIEGQGTHQDDSDLRNLKKAA